MLAGANQPVHWFLGSKGLGIQKERVYGLVCPNLHMCRNKEERLCFAILALQATNHFY